MGVFFFSGFFFCSSEKFFNHSEPVQTKLGLGGIFLNIFFFFCVFPSWCANLVGMVEDHYSICEGEGIYFFFIFLLLFFFQVSQDL